MFIPLDAADCLEQSDKEEQNNPMYCSAVLQTRKLSPSDLIFPQISQKTFIEARKKLAREDRSQNDAIATQKGKLPNLKNKKIRVANVLRDSI